ncbi:hypothetical protein [Sphingomonas parapaucimobilis]|uniref:hypothetical protein n=1 Tax=Sphingomonas parapaucimobilis TaxID=28213 RepID=UPI0035C8536A
MSEEATPDPFPVPASTARELLRCCPYGREAQRDAEEAIRRDDLPTYALYSSYQHDAGGWHTSQSKIIDDKLWRRIIADKQLDSFWKRSQVLLKWDGTVLGWDLRGIRIEPKPLIEFLARYGLAVTVDSNGQLQVPGQARALTGAGRNTYAHGAPIALLTLELDSGNFEKLGKKNGKAPTLLNLKAADLEERLTQLYHQFGIPAPTARSLHGLAAGVLQVLRKPLLSRPDPGS